eukprot:jgi/Chlat1/6246/Chrsp44S05852
MNTWQELPQDCLLRVLATAGARASAASLAVGGSELVANRYWRQVAESEDLWRQFCKEDYIEILPPTDESRYDLSAPCDGRWLLAHSAGGFGAITRGTQPKAIWWGKALIVSPAHIVTYTDKWLVLARTGWLLVYEFRAGQLMSDMVLPFNATLQHAEVRGDTLAYVLHAGTTLINNVVSLPYVTSIRTWQWPWPTHMLAAVRQFRYFVAHDSDDDVHNHKLEVAYFYPHTSAEAVNEVTVVNVANGDETVFAWEKYAPHDRVLTLELQETRLIVVNTKRLRVFDKASGTCLQEVQLGEVREPLLKVFQHMMSDPVIKHIGASWHPNRDRVLVSMPSGAVLWDWRRGMVKYFVRKSNNNTTIIAQDNAPAPSWLPAPLHVSSTAPQRVHLHDARIVLYDGKGNRFLRVVDFVRGPSVHKGDGEGEEEEEEGVNGGLMAILASAVRQVTEQVMSTAQQVLARRGMS